MAACTSAVPYSKHLNWYSVLSITNDHYDKQMNKQNTTYLILITSSQPFKLHFHVLLILYNVLLRRFYIK